mmetsp:Transcript_5837/g.13808  ORF Transcript_5837/g.13808 Transcript_5837/m.13808 type:complete len:346 (+) Transcript_5837:13-1050(+)
MTHQLSRHPIHLRIQAATESFSRCPTSLRCSNSSQVLEQQQQAALRPPHPSTNTPQVLELMANLGATAGGAQAPWADRDGFFNVPRAKGRLPNWVAVCHGADHKHHRDLATPVVLLNLSRKLPQLHSATGNGEAEAAAAGRQVLLYGIGHHLHERLVCLRRPDLVPLQQLHRETSKALKGPRNAQGGMDFDEHVLCCVEEDQQLASLVQWAVQQGHEALVRDVRPHVGDVAAVLGADVLVVVAVQQLHGPFLRLHTFQRALLEDHDDAACSHALLEGARQQLVSFGWAVDFVNQALSSLLGLLIQVVAFAELLTPLSLFQEPPLPQLFLCLGLASPLPQALRHGP